jgi:DNA repair protein RecO
MIIHTQAIALQIRPWSKTSHVVTWLTPDHGRVVTSVKGACRPKSAFLGQYDLFYTCDLLFYRRDHEGLHAIRECAPVALRERLRSDWRSAVAAAYLADLTARVSVGHHETGELFALLSGSLDLLDSSPGWPARSLVLWYETHVLRLLGVLPDLAVCPLCHPPEKQWLRFSLPAGRFLCGHLSRPAPGEATLSLHRGVQALFEALCQAGSPHDARLLMERLTSNKCAEAENLLFGLSRFLGMFMAFHLDVTPAVRRVAWEMFDTTPRAGTCAIGD